MQGTGDKEESELDMEEEAFIQEVAGEADASTSHYIHHLSKT